MPVNNLRRMVREMDRERATPSRLEPERLILPTRPSATPRRICWDCRRPLNLETFRARWLEEHPLPRSFCPPKRKCYVREHYGIDAAKHRAWHEELHAEQMPALDDVVACPFCKGRLITVEW